MLANIDINTFWIALSSGLLGALITAILNYLVRAKLASRDLTKREKRIAYVYFIKLSQLIGFIISIRHNYSEMLMNQLNKSSIDFSKPGGIHLLCFFIAKALNESSIMDEIKNNIVSFEMMEKTFSHTFNHFSLPDELLAQFPRQAVVYYNRFILSISSTVTHSNQWVYWAKTNDLKTLTGQTLYMQYLSFKILIETSQKLYEAIKNKSGISSEEADRTLNEQKEDADRVIKENLMAESLMKKLGELFTEKHNKE
jgi:hypothetical protein